MAVIVALDSATDACSVALDHNGKISHLFELAAKSHTQRLLPMVDEILRAGNILLQDVDAIAFGRGPGSFTGLRICMGIVQGLAFGANLPVIPVSTLQAMARGFMADHPDNHLPILAALDARMGEIYWGLFAANEMLTPLSDEFVMKPAEVCVHALVAPLAKQFVAVGPGWHYADLQVIAPEKIYSEYHPNAKDMVVLAAKEFNQHKIMSILDAQPVYLRDSVTWQKRQRIRTEPINNA